MSASMTGPNETPRLAIGHAALESRDVNATIAFFASLGARVVMAQQTFAIAELRGGTHVVIRSAGPNPRSPSFDLMVEDVRDVRHLLINSGLEPSPLRSGGVHKSFEVQEPGGTTLTFTSSHAMGRV